MKKITEKDFKIKETTETITINVLENWTVLVSIEKVSKVINYYLSRSEISVFMWMYGEECNIVDSNERNVIYEYVVEVMKESILDEMQNYIKNYKKLIAWSTTEESINPEYFSNDKFKVLKVLSDNQRVIADEVYIPLNQQRIGSLAQFSKLKVNKILNELIDLEYVLPYQNGRGEYAITEQGNKVIDVFLTI